MTFSSPFWLLLAIPLALALIRWRPATRALWVLRVSAFIAVVLALARLAIVMPSRQGTVVVVADRSASMPRDADAREREAVRDLETSRGDSRLGVVSFGRTANVEAAPDGGRFTAFQGETSADASNLRDGLDTALGLIPPNSSGRIVVLSDGRWSGRDPAPAALVAADRGISIDSRMVERAMASDTAVESIDAPGTVSPGEVFLVTATIRSPIPQEAAITLRRGEVVVAEGKQRLTAGSNRVTFRDRASMGGVLPYTVEVRGAGADPQPENNTARFLVGVNGPKPVLVVPGSQRSRFASLLQAGGLQVDVRKSIGWTLEELSGYSAVVLENLPAEHIGVTGMQTLAAWVRSGGALMITGGEGSFAGGGYFHSPLDSLIPVSMEMRREHRKLDLAIVIAMDRSGSMAVPAGGGKTKMDLADLAAVQVLDLLGPSDELGVVAVDSISHIIAEVAPIGSQEADLRRRIQSVDSAGGGIFIYEALATAAKMMVSAHSPTKHILLFADANDSEEPGDYKELVAKCVRANITISVVGLGTAHDSDAGLLRDIAARGGGSVYFTDDPGQLPRIFAQDTFVVARAAFVHDPTTVHATPAMLSLSGRSFPQMPQLGGYNLTYLRPGAAPAVLTDDEYHAPVVASWQVGLGRVLAYTGEADGANTGAMAKWSDVGTFYTSLARWVAGASTGISDEVLVRQHVENGAAKIELHLDPERGANPITHPPRVVTLTAGTGAAATSSDGSMHWISPDLLAAEVPLQGSATSLSTVAVEGLGRVTLPPVCAPYSPEHLPVDPLLGRASLEQLARATGGRERLAVADVWKDLPSRRREVPLRNWLIAAAMLLLLAETAERRMAWFAGASLPAAVRPAKAGRRSRAASPQPIPGKRPVVAEPAPEPADDVPAPEADPLVTALRRAGDRAKNRIT